MIDSNTKFEPKTDLYFIHLLHLYSITTDPSNADQYFQNLHDIALKINIKGSLKLIYQNRTLLQIFIMKEEFKVPNYVLFYQKKGKLFKKHIFQKCFVAQNSFGRLKKNSQKVQKPSYYYNCEVVVERKEDFSETQERKRAQTEKGILVQKDFKWPDVKDIEGYDCRLRFTDLKEKRVKAVYFREVKDAQIIKNNAIFERLVHQNRDSKNVAQKIVNMWKVQMAGNFYSIYLRKFFCKQGSFKLLLDSLTTINQKVKDEIKAMNFNVNESTYKDNNKADFFKNAHAPQKEQAPKEQTIHISKSQVSELEDVSAEMLTNHLLSNRNIVEEVTSKREPEEKQKEKEKASV